MSLLDILTEKKLIASKDVPALQEEARALGTDIEKILIKYGVSAQNILKAKSEYSGIPFRVMGDKEVAMEVLKLVPEESAIYYRFVPIGLKNGALEIGLTDPDNIEARDAINFIASKSNLPYVLYLISPDEFDRVAGSYKGLSGEVTKALSELESELSTEEEDIEFVQGGGSTPQKVDTKIIEDAPVTKIVATILHYASDGNASDIHIEHMGDKVRVRFRVDGVLNTSLILPTKVHPAVVARIKILSNMRLDEKRKPQDGRFSARIEGRRIDFRVSTFPSFYGEKIVMRILDTEKGVLGLDKMGISPRNLEAIREGIKRPYGMILVSGPTGSGKSTTLYSMLNEVDRETKNVLSLEDPVEYNIPGMNQSQMHPEIGYTFASGLRTTLRQDPDIIMVGEIRDRETAQLAVQAALTGHLVLSTIHTNSAAGVIPRLIDMGVDPYLIPTTIILAIAQRLVKTAYPDACKVVPVSGSIEAILKKDIEEVPEEFRSEFPPMNEVLEISPTPECPSGTRGRTAVFEVLKMDKELERLVVRGKPSDDEVMKIGRKQGMFTMREDAIIKALNKIIPIEEVNKL